MKEAPHRLENESIEDYVDRIQAMELFRGNSKTIRPGHLYQLRNMESKEEFQILQFIEKEPKWPGSTEMVTVHDGTTNEAVLEMLINRMKYQYEKLPSEETAMAIKHLESALRRLEVRTIRRMARGVEGRNEA